MPPKVHTLAGHGEKKTVDNFSAAGRTLEGRVVPPKRKRVLRKKDEDADWAPTLGDERDSDHEWDDDNVETAGDELKELRGDTEHNKEKKNPKVTKAQGKDMTDEEFRAAATENANRFRVRLARVVNKYENRDGSDDDEEDNPEIDAGDEAIGGRSNDPEKNCEFVRCRKGRYYQDEVTGRILPIPKALLGKADCDCDCEICQKRDRNNKMARESTLRSGRNL